jgi:hypothetical protein
MWNNTEGARIRVKWDMKVRNVMGGKKEAKEEEDRRQKSRKWRTKGE